MVIIESEIAVRVPRNLCFDLARSIEVHIEAEAHTRESVVAGRTSGLLDLADTVIFEAVHFGVRQRLTSKIVELHSPEYFIDEMQRGAFRSLRHSHFFFEITDGTLMRDRLEFEAPFGLLGRMAEHLFLKRYMQRFIERHQREFRKIAERDFST